MAPRTQLRDGPLLRDQQYEPGLPAERHHLFQPNVLTGAKVPPSSLRTIGDALSEKGISWAYYGGGYNAAVRVANGSTDPVDQLIGKNYCDICNPFSYVTSIMGSATERPKHIKDAIDFFSALDNGKLPSVAFVKPDSIVDGHPASAKLDLFEAMLENIVDKLKAHPDLFRETAFFVTFDEGGGYWNSGFHPAARFLRRWPSHPDARNLSLFAGRQDRAQLQRSCIVG